MQMDVVESFTSPHNERIRSLCELLTGKASRGLFSINVLLDSFLALYSDLCHLDKKTPYVKSFIDKNGWIVPKLKSLRVNTCDFDKIKTLASGAIGKVYLVRYKPTKAVYAMKILKKEDLLSMREAAFYMQERNALVDCVKCFWITTLFASFQDEENLYLLMEYAPGGSLRYLINKNDGPMTEEDARFYISEIVLALEEVHKIGYVHRDIKPENCLIDSNGHIKLADFGSCVSVNELCKSTSHETVGTPDYISPEVLMLVEGTSTYGVECDWWSLGIVIYELVYDDVPFYSESLAETYAKIMAHENHLRFPSAEELPVSNEALDLMKKLITKRENRLGKSGASEIKSHPWFSGVNWSNIRSTRPPFVPELSGPEDTKYFEDEEEIERRFFGTTKKIERHFCGANLSFIGYYYMIGSSTGSEFNVFGRSDMGGNFDTKAIPAKAVITPDSANIPDRSIDNYSEDDRESPRTSTKNAGIDTKGSINGQRLCCLEVEIFEDASNSDKIRELMQYIENKRADLDDLDALRNQVEEARDTEAKLKNEIMDYQEKLLKLEKSEEILRQGSKIANSEIAMLKNDIKNMEIEHQKFREKNLISVQQRFSSSTEEFAKLNIHYSSATQNCELEDDLSVKSKNESKETKANEKQENKVTEYKFASHIEQHHKTSTIDASEAKTHSYKLKQYTGDPKNASKETQQSRIDVKTCRSVDTSKFDPHSKTRSTNLEEEIDILRKKYSLLEEANLENIKQKEILEKYLKSNQEENARLKLIREDYTSAREIISGSDTESISLRDIISKYKSQIEKMEFDQKKLSSRCDYLESQYGNQVQVITALETKNSKSEQKFESVERECADLRSKYEAVIAEHSSCKSTTKELNTIISELRAENALKDTQVQNLHYQIEGMKSIYEDVLEGNQEAMIDTPKQSKISLNCSDKRDKRLSINSDDKFGRKGGSKSGIALKNTAFKIVNLKSYLPFYQKLESNSSDIRHGSLEGLESIHLVDETKESTTSHLFPHKITQNTRNITPHLNEPIRYDFDQIKAKELDYKRNSAVISNASSRIESIIKEPNFTPQREINILENIRGVLRVPKTSKIANGWKTKFAVLEEYKLYLFDREKDANMKNTECAEIIGLKSWLVIVRICTMNELIHTSARNVCCAFKLQIADKDKSAEQCDYDENNNRKNYESVKATLELEKEILSATERMKFLSSESSKSAIQRQIKISKNRINVFNVELENLKSGALGVKRENVAECESISNEAIEACSKIISDRLSLQEKKRVAILKISLARMQLEPDNHTGGKPQGAENVLNNFQEELDQCDKTKSVLMKDLKDLFSTDKEVVGRVLRRWTPGIENDVSYKGHNLKSRLGYRPIECNVCNETIWPSGREYLECVDCRVSSHNGCRMFITLSCSQMIALKSAPPMYFMASSIKERDRWISALEQQHKHWEKYGSKQSTE